MGGSASADPQSSTAGDNDNPQQSSTADWEQSCSPATKYFGAADGTATVHEDPGADDADQVDEKPRWYHEAVQPHQTRIYDKHRCQQTHRQDYCNIFQKTYTCYNEISLTILNNEVHKLVTATFPKFGKKYKIETYVKKIKLN